MKSLRGFTLIEVLIATAIVGILLPLLGVVFYQLMVSPPEQAIRLNLNNEVSLLSSYLYDDAHMAENFSVGTFPVYGYFSWTNYSTGAFYCVSYYYTGDCGNCSSGDSTCLNTCGHVARTVNITYNCDTCNCSQ